MHFLCNYYGTKDLHSTTGENLKLRVFQQYKTEVLSVEVLPPTSPNFRLHMLQTRLILVLWQQLTKQGQFQLCRRLDGSCETGGVACHPLRSRDPPAPPQMEEILVGSLQSRYVQVRVCGYQGKHMLCTMFYKCVVLFCHNPYNVEKDEDS